MGRKQREDMVAALSKKISETKGVIVVDYTGLSVEMVMSLRRQIKEVGSELKVAKNTLLRIASKGTSLELLHDFFVGQTAIAFINGDPAQTAKVLTKYIKENLKINKEFSFKIRAGVLDENMLTEEDINQLGSLPSREVLLGQFVGLLASPLVGLVSVLSDIPRKFLRVLTAVADQKAGKN